MFTDGFLELRKRNPNVTHNIQKEIKNNIDNSIDTGLYSQVVVIRN